MWSLYDKEEVMGSNPIEASGPVHTDVFSFENANIVAFSVSRPHENDVSFSMKTQTFENDLQSGKIWKHNSISVVWMGQN